MKLRNYSKAVKYIEKQIASHTRTIEILSADLAVLIADPPDVPTWECSVSSAWSSEGEPDWDGEIQAPDVKDAVYAAMLAFCKKAGRVYPGYVGGTGTTYDQFDVQGTIYLSMALPNGTSIPVERSAIDRYMKEFNRKAPMPKKRPRPKVAGLT